MIFSLLLLLLFLLLYVLHKLVSCEKICLNTYFSLISQRSSNLIMLRWSIEKHLCLRQQTQLQVGCVSGRNTYCDPLPRQTREPHFYDMRCSCQAEPSHSPHAATPSCTPAGWPWPNIRSRRHHPPQCRSCQWYDLPLRTRLARLCKEAKSTYMNTHIHIHTHTQLKSHS